MGAKGSKERLSKHDIEFLKGRIFNLSPIQQHFYDMFCIQSNIIIFTPNRHNTPQ